jgi:6-phosphogluconolactonase
MRRAYVYATPADAASACAQSITDGLAGAIERAGHASLAVSGGSTPKLMFEKFAAMDFPWKRVHLFWVDERCVPPDHADSNYRMTDETLLRHVDFAGVYRIQGELTPEAAAETYRRDLIEYFDGPPRFDVIHLGMGADGHTASLFPGLEAIDDTHGVVGALWVPKLNAHRITLMPAVLLAAASTVILTAGKDKADALREVFAGPYTPHHLPIQLIDHKGSNVSWYLDRAATEKLPEPPALTT